MNKFNIGDQVVLLRSNTEMCQLNSYKGKFSTGYIGTITDVYGDKSVKIDNEGAGCWIHVSQIAPAPKYNNKPHIHHDLIIEWARGAVIEFKNANGIWKILGETILWKEDLEYRIKPDKTEREIKLEELKEQARKLADEIEGLQC